MFCFNYFSFCFLTTEREVAAAPHNILKTTTNPCSSQDQKMRNDTGGKRDVCDWSEIARTVEGRERKYVISGMHF
jgi:hypothetical protein